MITTKNINKSFGIPAQTVLHNVSISIKDGEFVAISGKSGSGKSTLLYIISTLDNATSGELFIDNTNGQQISSDELHLFRNKKVGFVFQFHYLLPELTALENVLLPARNLNLIAECTPLALSLLEELGVLAQKDKFPSQMSGGEQQRVAIARALILKPKYLFADEPTGNLDTANAEVVMKILMRANQEWKTTIVLVTHDPDFAKLASREIYLVDGKVSTKT